MAKESYTNSVIRMATGFFFVFMAFNTTQALETTILKDKTLARVALGVLYAVFTATTIFAPKVVDLVGPRLSMAVGAIPYVLMVFANLAPSYGLLLPASAGVGFGAGVLWTGQGIYMSRCAIRESLATGEPVEAVTSRMNGIFWTMFQFNGALGLVISSIILERVPDFQTAVTYMFTAFGAVGAVGIGVLLLVKSAPPLSETAAEDNEADSDPLTRSSVLMDAEGDKDKGKDKITLYETLRLVRTSPAMQLLLPIIFYNGVSLGFNGGTFPLVYQDDPTDNKTLLLPQSIVGYQAATFYFVNSIASFLWGKIIPRIGRRPLFFVAFITQLVYYIVVICLANNVIALEHESAAAYCVVFALAALFGIGDSVLESQIPAIVQSPTFWPVERDRDAANSNVRMWQSLGFAVQFGMGIRTTPAQQAYFCLPLMFVALLALWACDRFVKPVDSAKAEAEYETISTADA